MIIACVGANINKDSQVFIRQFTLLPATDATESDQTTDSDIGKLTCMYRNFTFVCDHLVSPHYMHGSVCVDLSYFHIWNAYIY